MSGKPLTSHDTDRHAIPPKADSDQLRQLLAQLPHCMQMERSVLRKRLHKAQNRLRQGQPITRDLSEIAASVQASSARYAARLALVPQISYPEDLPVSARREEIAAAIARHQVVIVCGETGSGKTTQLPKICLQLGRGVAGLIGHTQPRRIAARSVASRIAQELQSSLGQAVGYKVRFNDKLSADNYIKLMTDGILLAETQGDRLLEAYDTIILDEAHERSLNIDFLLGYLKQLLPRRPDLKVIVTSATIDVERFSAHFDQAPVIEVSGRTYPVEIRYRPLGRPGVLLSAADSVGDQEDDLASSSPDLLDIQQARYRAPQLLVEEVEDEAIEEAILDAAEDLLRLGDGDILVFLPGEREIRDTAEYLRKYRGRSSKLRQIEILPLFARLSIAEQQKIFHRSAGTRIVLATNVAETSLTVPGIKYVIDSGLARINRYSARAKVEQLQIEKISQAAARQRAGRCGRVSNGICVRLYTEDDFQARPEFTDPEILRSSLAAVILRMTALKLGEVSDFPFIEAPSARLINDGFQLLQELGAVDEQHQLTTIGRQLARLPLDPRMGRMVLAAKQEACLHEILVIASVLALRDPRDRPLDKREAADQAHKKFAHEQSDFMSFLKLWEFYETVLKSKQSNKALREQCQRHFLSVLRMREWRELYMQIRQIVEEMKFRPNTVAAGYEQIHRALLAGLLGNIGFRDGSAETYLGARGIRFTIAPGSVLRKARPKWVMAAELVETSKLYARCVARIEPDWIEPLARGLTASHYSDPRWDRRGARVVAWERVSLYGLTIVPKRRVHYGAINAQESREILLREALVNMEFDTRADFFSANRQLIAEIEDLEHKTRRQDVLVDEDTLFAFYDQRVGQQVFNGASFESWRREAERAQPRLLYLSRQDLMRHGAESVTEKQFPETLQLGDSTVQLKYRFEPGHPLDGVTATIPLAVLNQLDPSAADWLVPGMIRDKITHLVKALPKTLRRLCVPVPGFVTAFLQESEKNRGALLPQLAAYIEQRTRLKCSASDWQDDLPEHLYMNFRVVDGDNHELGMGRNWTQLQQRLGQAAQLTFRSASPDIEQSGLKQWNFGALPETLSFSRQQGMQTRQLTGYPALEDQGDSVAIRLFDTAPAAQQAHRVGVRRLLRLELKAQMKQLEKSLPGFTQYALILRHLLPPDQLREELLTAIADRAFIGEDALPRTAEEFAALKQRARVRLPAVVSASGHLLQEIAAEYQNLQQKLAALPASMARIRQEIEQQQKQLLPPHFMNSISWERWQHLPRYLRALTLRLEKYPGNIERDSRHAQEIKRLWQRWSTTVEALQHSGTCVAPELADFRWQLEELRVSLFAQELKTPFPVSVKRLDRLWQQLV